MRNSIRKFYVIVAIVFVVIALGLFVQFNYFNGILTEETQMLTASSLDSIGSQISSDLLSKGQIIADAADYIALQKWNNEELLAYLKRLETNNSSYSSVYYGTKDNLMINGSGWVPPQTFDLRTRPWYIQAVKESKLIFTDVFINASKDKLIITIAKPVYDSNNQLLGVIAGDVSIKDIVSLVKDKKITSKGYSFLIDGQGNILAHPKYDYGPTSKLKNVNEISKELTAYLSQNKPGITKISLDGIDGYIAYQAIEKTNWKIGSFIPLNEYMRKDLQFMRIFLITLISSFTVFIIFLWQQKRYLINPLLTLGKDIQKINVENNRDFRLPTEKNEPLEVLRKSINVVLDKTQELFGQLQLKEEKLNKANEELGLYVLQLTASKADLGVQYEQILESEYTFRTLFHSSADAILIIVDNELIDCNAAFCELLGYASKEDIIGINPWALSPELQPDGKRSEEIVLEIISTTLKNGKCKFEWWYQKSNGILAPVEVMMTTILLNGNKVFHSLWRDVSERKKMELQLGYLSYHDQLTGLYNRRFFEEELKRLDVARNYPLTIVMADVNGLKLVNDSFGHSIGDELIKKVARVIEKGCRSDDVIARLGGDEFVIILPKISNNETEQIIKRIKGNVLKERLGSVEISVSFGWETKTKDEEKMQDIFKKAEDHMYKKKLFESPSMRGKTIKAIMNTLHEKNKREEQHSHRVSALCKSMGEVLGLPEYEVEELKSVGLLHDIGKIAVDENVLNKPGELTEDEWEEIKRHPEIGYRILNTVEDMSEMANCTLYHHERWDGKGYPRGLTAEQIPFVSRIITIADAYDAMTSERSYRSALPEGFVIEELRKSAGMQFDPEMVRVFIEKVLGQTID
jgi:diguanylate cyclase (GGDEF)-like protein/PAS domain S-box-containing protein